MPVNWPSTLPQEFLPQGYDEKLPEALLRTPMDAGPDKSRPLFTSAGGRRTVVIDIDQSQRQTLDYFWRVTTKSGEVSVNMPVPIVGGTEEVILTNAPRVDADGARYLAQLQYKIL